MEDDNVTPGTPLVPSEVARRASRSVVGSAGPLARVSAFVCMHATRASRVLGGTPSSLLVPPAALLVIGPTGSGKTHLVTEVARAAGLHSVTVDCSSLTGEGWRGHGVSDCMLEVARWQGRNPGRPCVVVFDEADKVVGKGTGAEPSFDPQANILKLLDGGTMAAGSRGQDVTFDADGCVFVMAGSFHGVAEAVRSRMRRAARSDGRYDDPSARLSDSEATALADQRDIVSLGIIPELAGRVGQIVAMPSPTAESIAGIITGPGGIAERASNTMPGNCRFSVSDEAARAIAASAAASGFGARRASSLLGPLVTEAWGELAGDEGLVAAEVIVDGGRIGIGYSSASADDPRLDDGRDAAPAGRRASRDERDRLDAAVGLDRQEVEAIIAAGGARRLARAVMGRPDGERPDAPCDYLEALLLLVYCHSSPDMAARGRWFRAPAETYLGSCLAVASEDASGQAGIGRALYGPDPGRKGPGPVARRYWAGRVRDSPFSRALFRSYWDGVGSMPDDERRSVASEVTRRLLLVSEGAAGRAAASARGMVEAAAGGRDDGKGGLVASVRVTGAAAQTLMTVASMVGGDPSDAVARIVSDRMEAIWGGAAVDDEVVHRLDRSDG